VRRLINQRPGRTAAALLTAVPFLLVLIAYLVGSDLRLAANPNDKLLPAPSRMAETFHELMLVPDKRSGEYLLWSDTAASLLRLALGVSTATLFGLGVGVAIGALPLVRAALAPFVAALSLIPPLAILPILFIIFGLGEVAKVSLIALGTAPVITRDIAQRVIEIPAEQLVKAQTLGASSWQIVLRVILPQTLPRLVVAVRLSLGAAWLFLISSEAIAATGGLGYRIFLVRRYLAMDTIIPYVLWITLLAFLIDQLLRLLSERAFRWSRQEAASL